LYKWFLGDIIVYIQNQVTDKVTVKPVPYWHERYSQPEPLTKLGELNMSAMVTIVCEIQDRTHMIVEQVMELVPSGRQVLILSDRRFHCEQMFQVLKKKGVDVGLYIGGMKKEQYEESEKKQVLVATFQLVAEGFDVPRLDTLVLASPKSDVVQACGRILRHGGHRKNEPLIIDIQDQWSVFYSQARKRGKTYEESGFVVIDF
jgi:predicted helicase